MPATALPVLNLAAYRFVAIEDEAERAVLRERLHAAAERAALKGTMLLAPEGINLVLAGAPDAARGFIDALRADPRFGDLDVKESWSSTQPFRHLRVKLKREIIRMDYPAIRPQTGRAPSVDASTLARWLDAGRCDAGRPLLLLDTRNGFEVDAGRFAGALDWRLGKFSDFPDALAAQQEQLAGKTVVSYCTGGIRCEKAALLMREQGVEHVLQLDGGILKYLQTAGPHHFDGACFVFDDRRLLDGVLEPAG